jgi:cbb3-type cytochrome oxidase subunit 3
MSETYGWILSLWQLWLVIVFVAIVAWVFWPKHKRRLERQGEIPFKNDDRDH